MIYQKPKGFLDNFYKLLEETYKKRGPTRIRTEVLGVRFPCDNQLHYRTEAHPSESPNLIIRERSLGAFLFRKSQRRTKKKVLPLAGLEPATLGLKGPHSNQLSYSGIYEYSETPLTNY